MRRLGPAASASRHDDGCERGALRWRDTRAQRDSGRAARLRGSAYLLDDVEIALGGRDVQRGVAADGARGEVGLAGQNQLDRARVGVAHRPMQCREVVVIPAFLHRTAPLQRRTPRIFSGARCAARWPAATAVRTFG